MDVVGRTGIVVPLVAAIGLVAACSSSGSGGGSHTTTPVVTTSAAAPATSTPAITSASSAAAAGAGHGTATLTLTKDINDNLNGAPTTCTKDSFGEIIYIVTATKYHVTITQAKAGSDEQSRVVVITTSHIQYVDDSSAPVAVTAASGGARLDGTIYGPGIPPNNNLEIKISGTVTCTVP